MLIRASGVGERDASGVRDGIRGSWSSCARIPF